MKNEAKNLEFHKMLFLSSEKNALNELLKSEKFWKST